LTIPLNVFFFSMVVSLELLGADELTVVEEIFPASTVGNVGKVGVDSIHVVNVSVHVNKELSE